MPLVETPSSQARILKLLATSAAAATAAFVASRLGVAGTIVGAAIISVVASIGAEFYTLAASRTTDRVAARARSSRVEGAPTAGLQEPHGVPSATSEPDGDAGEVRGPSETDSGALKPRRELRFSWRHVAVVASVVFVAVVVAITALELVAGRPLSSWWTGDDSTGTTIGSVVAPPVETVETSPPSPEDPEPVVEATTEATSPPVVPEPSALPPSEPPVTAAPSVPPLDGEAGRISPPPVP